MRRRTFLRAAGIGLVAVVAGGAAVWSQVPPIPKRPDPNSDTALSWIAHHDGRFTLTIPRAEMGQNITTALKQIACAELGVSWHVVDVALHDTTIAGVKPSVGSESMQLFAEPLARACASLRDALAAGRTVGEIEVTERPRAELISLQRRIGVEPAPPIEQGLEIITGQPLYAADVSPPGIRYGRVLRASASVEVASRARSWNEDAARAVSGFIAIVPNAGLPVGKAVGLGIVASRPGALDAIAEALDVKWGIDGAPANSDVTAAIDIDKRLGEGAMRHSISDGAIDDGPFDVDLRIDVPLAAHAPIEPRAAVADWTQGQLKVWAGTQDAFYVRDVLSDTFGIGADDVVVQSMRVGGGFGGKTICTVEAEAAALARAVGAPVKVQWTRAQEYALGFHRPPSSHRIKLRVTDGKVTDWDHSQVSSHIMFTSAVVPPWMQRATDLVAGDGGVARGMAVPYIFARNRAGYDTVRLPIHTGPWRGLGAGPNALATESAMDEAAWLAKADPLRFRLDHIKDPRLRGVVERVGKIAQWNGPNPSPNRGRGIACGIYKGVSYAAAIADVVVDNGVPRVTGLWCVHDCGFVVNPDQVRAQCEGNLVWSIGMVLHDLLPVENGFVAAQTFADAPIPIIGDVSPITVDLIESDAPPTGSGETAIVAGPAAIANAIRAATGNRPTRFPIEQATA